MPVPRLIYKVLYIALHAIYTLAERLVDIVIKLQFKYNTQSHEFFTNNGLTQKLNKVPNHLTIILGHEEEPCLKDLANIVIWCLAVRINFVSFYDYKGVIRQSEAQLQYYIEEKKSKDDHIIWSKNTTLKNGYLGRKIYIKLFSGQNGKPELVNLTKTLALSSSCENIEGLLREHYQFPDPDLGLCCGATFSLYNYPPWQIRVTEFIHIKNHHNLRFEQFAKVLMKYSRCEQRYGK